MSGVAGRSGKRAFLPTSEKLDLPDLGFTEQSVAEYSAAVNKAVARRQIDPRTADSLHKGAAIHLNAIKQKQKNAEMDELRTMLADTRKMQQEGLAYETAQRQHLDK